jgi:predicted nuclease of predicted toxin-antitoxin system
LSLRLLVDEDTQAHLLVELLRADGHDLLTVSEASLTAKPDATVLNFARCEQRVLLTRNCDDFLLLHEADPVHSGILAVYQDAAAKKAMNYAAIVRAIANLESTKLPLFGQFIVLNHYNW